MPQLTWVQRLSDPLILTAEENKDLVEFTELAKKILRGLRANSPSPYVVEAGDHYFMYVIDNDVCFLTLCDKSYPKKLAAAFLDEIKKEFDIQYGPEVRKAERPYAFIKFDIFIQRTKKLYLDTKSERNLDKVTKELGEATKIMTKSISDVLDRGKKISNVQEKSNQLVMESKAFEKDAKWLSTKMFWRKWAPVIIVLFIVLFCFYLRFAWFY
eukprot:TRINITY_DN9506_c0_g1_i1.p1 TRINITY_DN9506_c0_g1~~TRINITY_DN9506_c0_g1_i1.p1  ORF type:complete len:213 (-),score=54.94 TRINITY_DN9506_c0_g1_i1:647-1285(-)